MVMPEHTCPYGLKSLDLLRRNGFEVKDHHLTVRGDRRVKAEHGVKTTPQTFIARERVGGYDDLRRRSACTWRSPARPATGRSPALFAMTALLVMAASHAAFGSPFTLPAL